MKCNWIFSWFTYVSSIIFNLKWWPRSRNNNTDMGHNVLFSSLFLLLLYLDKLIKRTDTFTFTFADIYTQPNQKKSEEKKI